MAVWAFQGQFVEFVQHEANKLFAEVSPKINPHLFLIGIPMDDRSVVVESELLGIDSSAFASVAQAAYESYISDPKSAVHQDDPLSNKRYHERLRLKHLRVAVSDVIYRNLNEHTAVAYLSPPVQIDQFFVFVGLNFETNLSAMVPSLRGKEYVYDEQFMFPIPRSFVEAVIHEFLRASMMALYVPNAGMRLPVIDKDSREMLRHAGQAFMSTISTAVTLSTSFFEICNDMASERYEGMINDGTILLAPPGHEQLKPVITLEHPVSLNHPRMVRKLMEICSPQMHLHTDGSDVLGFSQLLDTPSERTDLFRVDFVGDRTWQLSHEQQVLMRVEHGIPRLVREKIDREKFSSTLSRMFPEMSVPTKERLWASVVGLLDKKHGALIMISDKASDEAGRLRAQSIKINALELTPDIAAFLCTIDGSLLVDTRGQCHSVGVILDGLASSKGTPSRGARYNSAIRYVESSENKALAIIISEDGMVDIYPDLRPQIRRSEIMAKLVELRDHAGQPWADYATYSTTLQWFKDNSFYLLPEVCLEINLLKRSLLAKTLRLPPHYKELSDFVPDPAMNASYYIPEERGRERV